MDLKDVIEYLESGSVEKTVTLPVIPALPPGEPNLDPNPAVATCGECSRTIHRMESYWCSNPRCPVQSRTTC